MLEDVPTTRTVVHLCVTFLIVLLVLGFLGYYRLSSSRPLAPYPPGPKGLPLIGNTLDMPKTHVWHTFTEWGNTYGDIVYVNVLGQPMLILNSAKQAELMLDKKSSIYSSRPTLPMGGELIGWDQMILLMPYGPRFREHRRYIHQSIGSKASMQKHHAVLINEIRKCLRRLLQAGSTEDTDVSVAAEIRKTTAAIVLKITFGYTTREQDDPMVALAEKAADTLEAVFSPGLWLVDILPFLRYLPAWFPGAGFKKAAAEMRELALGLGDVPYEFTKNAMANNVHLPPNFVAENISREDLDDDAENNLKRAAAVIYAGGADTSVSAMLTFILAMMLYPDAQKRAQAEIDSVVGNERLPSFEDRDKLPFIGALIKETLRWRCIAPLTLPHCSTEDDIHEGYYIPKGTSVFANIWAILHDPKTYPNPNEFDPSRFVTETGETTSAPDPYNVCFGYGRRICPGVNFADTELFIWCSMILAVYDISKYVGPDGKAVEPPVEYTSAADSCPKPFKCSIVPRSERAERLIRSVDE